MENALLYFVRKHAWAVWVGGMLSAIGLRPWHWQFYVAIVPLIALVHWARPGSNQ